MYDVAAMTTMALHAVDNLKLVREVLAWSAFPLSGMDFQRDHSLAVGGQRQLLRKLCREGEEC